MKIWLIFGLLINTVLYAQTQDEREVYYLVNYCRTNPKDFLEKVVLPYIEVKELKNVSEAKSLIRALNKQKPLNALEFSEDLYKIASEYAKEMGNKGFTGHRSYTSRFKKNEVKYAYTGENCSYGYNNPLDIVMQLLIDQGVSDLGHRKNILSSNFTKIGISIHPHKKNQWTCVMDFGG